MSTDMIELFKGIGLSEVKAKDTAKNSNLSKNLEEAISAARSHSKVDVSPTDGMLLYHIASKIKPQIRQHLSFLAQYIVSGKLSVNKRLKKQRNVKMISREKDIWLEI
jgi:glutaminyl-tRNA synthetase